MAEDFLEKNQGADLKNLADKKAEVEQFAEGMDRISKG